MIYSIPKVTVKAEVTPGTISAKENAVLKVDVSTTENVAFKDAYIDLSALDGPAKVKLDTQLLEQSIAVKDSVSAGSKDVPVTIIPVPATLVVARMIFPPILLLQITDKG